MRHILCFFYSQLSYSQIGKISKKKKKKVTQGNRDNPEYKEKDLYLEIQEDETSIKQEQDAI